ncbi:OLC1v1005682C1 [Oldenlandia corymbosa var. corymbosa]|uniref:OLC1v1005682C1 n=1 Tax=Oldenlandia corymbosa var. corymbosa TaxID=529605 RepID=A0AAV1DH61_OLDCO|nr:OLC1v1005682C1 [Oldenlandia corymbosa var. corymbosa]
MSSKGQKRKQNNVVLRDEPISESEYEPISQAPRMTRTEINPYSANARYQTSYQGMSNKCQRIKKNNVAPRDDPISESEHDSNSQAPRMTRTKINPNGANAQYQIPNQGMSGKGRKCKQNNVVLRDEPISESEPESNSQAPRMTRIGIDTYGPNAQYEIPKRGATQKNSFGSQTNIRSQEEFIIDHMTGIDEQGLQQGLYQNDPMVNQSTHRHREESEIHYDPLRSCDCYVFMFLALPKKKILSSVGKKWRNWKNRLKAKYWYEALVEVLVDQRDARVTAIEWMKICTHWNSEAAKKISRRRKNARAKRVNDQKTGQTSFARVEHKMTKENGRPPSRVELLHACFLDSNGDSNPTILSANANMQERNSDVQENFDDSSDLIDQDDISAQSLRQCQSNTMQMVTKEISQSNAQGTVQNTSKHLRIEEQGNASQRSLQLHDIPNQNTPTPVITVGSYVSLKSVNDPTKIVAKGCIESMDPSKEVGGHVLGPNWCEVGFSGESQVLEALKSYIWIDF